MLSAKKSIDESKKTDESVVSCPLTEVPENVGKVSSEVPKEKLIFFLKEILEQY